MKAIGRVRARPVSDILLTVIVALIADQGAARGIWMGGSPTANVSTLTLKDYVLLVVIWALVLPAAGLYRPPKGNVALTWVRVSAATLIGALLLAGVLSTLSEALPPGVVIRFWVLDTIALLLFRILIGLVVRRFAPPRRVLIVGGGPAADDVVSALSQQQGSLVEIVAYSHLGSGNGVHRPRPRPDVPITDVPEFAARERIDDVIIALPPSQHELVLGLALDLQRQPVTVWLVPDVRELSLTNARLEEFGGVLMINLRVPRITGAHRAVKRAIDIVGASILILLGSPVMLLIALLIKLTSPGPVIFRQVRVGEGCKPFVMYKFRTMYDPTRTITLAPNGAHKMRNDPRVTPVGRYLREWSLDELPQLFNILIGDMSLVGPRPELPELVAMYDRWQYRRFTVPQGLTGLWQVSGRSDRPMHLHTEDDIAYVTQCSPWFDLMIIARTVSTVVSRRGAY